MTEILRGDKIWVRGPFGTRHYGISLGPFGACGHAVVHNSKVQGGVVIDTLARFAGGQEVHIESRAADGYAHVVANRALAYLGSTYELLSFNCEHLVNRAQTGEHKSQQLRNATGVGAVLVSVVGIMYARSRPTYDPFVDRYRNRRGQFTRR